MEEENGDFSSSESDVAPLLNIVTSEVDGFREEKKTIKIVDLKRDSDEELYLDESVFPVPSLPSGDFAVGDMIENPETTDDEAAEEQTEESEPEITVIEATPPEKQNTSVEKKTRVQVDPNATIKDTSDNVHYLSALPVVPEGACPYTPILYTFRVKAKGRASKLKNITSKPPPFYLQFDHTIAVIWTLFNKEANKENLGIVQLQWALHFLESIYNDEGIHPKDVQLCIDAIQNYLIDEYAEMSEESVVYGCSKFGDFVNEEEKKTQAPFSPNYAQMIKKCPPPSGVDTQESVILDRQLLDELENVKKVVGIDSIDLTKVVSKEQVMDILNEWKREQIDKIQEELKMLYVVEDMMKNSDSQNFEGYTDETQFECIFRKNK